MEIQVEIDKVIKYFEIHTTSFELYLSHIINSDEPTSLKILKLNDLIVLYLENLGFWVDKSRQLIQDMISEIDQRIAPMSSKIENNHADAYMILVPDDDPFYEEYSNDEYLAEKLLVETTPEKFKMLLDEATRMGMVCFKDNNEIIVDLGKGEEKIGIYKVIAKDLVIKAVENYKSISDLEEFTEEAPEILHEISDELGKIKQADIDKMFKDNLFFMDIKQSHYNIYNSIISDYSICYTFIKNSNETYPRLNFKMMLKNMASLLKDYKNYNFIEKYCLQNGKEINKRSLQRCKNLST